MKPIPVFILGIPSTKEGQRAAQIAEYIRVPGSSVLNCDLCGQGVIIGPRQLKTKQAQPELKIGCPLCLLVLQGPDQVLVKSLGGDSATFKLTDGTVIKP